MISIADKIATMWPEITLFIGTCIVMVLGLSSKLVMRKACSPVAGLSLIIAGLLALQNDDAVGVMPYLMPYAKALIAGVGLLLLMLLAGTVDRDQEMRIAGGAAFNPLSSTRAEFYAFFLFSLTGLMLCTGAEDLIWLFLALELTSLPTYIMVTISTSRSRGQEAGIKYFFLGALGAAIFLYGFALLYGGTGTTNLVEMQTQFAQGQINTIAMLGLILSVIGVSFKIAAVPMHFYTADVYQGAAAPVSAFLAFVPKAAGFFAIMLLVSTVGWNQGVAGGLPEPLHATLWMMAVATMTLGNVLALLQHSVKRMLAYSSIAHSGYMLVGVIAGPGETGSGSLGFVGNGLAAVLFYLFSYGVMNLGVFAVVACLEKTGDSGERVEAEQVGDLQGLIRTKPLLAVVLTICAFSLLGLPPMLGFFGKLPLFTSGIRAGEIPLVVILGLNSAIAAFYYLRLVKAAIIDEPAPNAEPLVSTPFGARTLAAGLSAAGVVVFIVLAGPVMRSSERAAVVRDVSALEVHDLADGQNAVPVAVND